MTKEGQISANIFNGAVQMEVFHKGPGMKFDTAKPDYTLVPWHSVEEIVKVLDFGAKKYARDNWKHVEGGAQRYLAAAFRHLAAHNMGEVNDPESGLSHLAHAGCCVLFLLSLEK